MVISKPSTQRQRILYVVFVCLVLLIVITLNDKSNRDDHDVGRITQERQLDRLLPTQSSENESLVAVPIETDLASESVGQETVQHEVVLPYKRKHFPVGSLAKSNLVESYFVSIEKAREGDPDALLEVADVLFNCYFGTGDPGPGVFWERYQSLGSSLALEQYQEMTSLIEECRPIIDDVSALDTELSAYQALVKLRELFLQQALDSGNKVALLRVKNFPTTGDWYEAARIADALVDSKDYRVLYEVAQLMAYVAPNEPVEYSKWIYLACIHHPDCDERVMSNNMEFVFSPDIQNRILDFADNFKTIQEHEYTFSSYVMNRYQGKEIPNPMRGAREFADRIAEELKQAD